MSKSLPAEIEYSVKYTDDRFEYRHVLLSESAYQEYQKLSQPGQLLTEQQVKHLGVMQSKGW